MTSASTRWMCLSASPIAWLPVAQAVTTAEFGPFAPKRMDTSPDAILTIIIGMKKGDTRSGPFSRSVSWLESRVWIPPIPEPISTPKRSPFTFAMSSPASSTAITLQAIAYWRNWSRRRASFLSTYFSGSKFRTSAAIRVG